AHHLLEGVPRRRGRGAGHPEGHRAAAGGRLCAQYRAGRRLRPGLQLPPVHGAADLRGAGADGPPGGRGRPGPLRRADPGVRRGGAADVPAGRVRRGDHDVHPDLRRLRQLPGARRRAQHHDRQDHRGPVPGEQRLPDGRGDHLRADGGAAGRHLRLRPGAGDQAGDGGAGPMTATTEEARPATRPAARRRPRRRIDWGKYFTWAVIAWLLSPIAFMIAFSFNDAQGRHNVTWQGFTLHWYADVFAYPDLTRALVNSLLIAVLTMLIAGVLGGLLGLALGRYRFRGKPLTDLVMFSAISAPEVVLGAGLLSMFLTMNIATGFWTILIAHVMFSVSFVAITVRARVLALDPALEEAARDLGASPWTTFRLVTLPMLFPALMAGGLIALHRKS